MTQKMSGARATVEALEREKVEYIFGMPGGANLPFYDALWDSKIKHVLVRHEQLAAHMADAYGRVSRKAGVCSATSGPGATNLITGIATAFADSSPVVAITGQVPKGMTGRNAFQETDVIGIATPITKYTLQPLSAAEVPFAVKTAFYIATTGRPGPVLLDLPKDVQQEEAEMTFPESVSVRFSDRSTGNFAEFAPSAKIIHIDADPTEFNKNKAVDLSILGDANQVLAMLFDAIARRLAKSKDPSSNPW